KERYIIFKFWNREIIIITISNKNIKLLSFKIKRLVILRQLPHQTMLITTRSTTGLRSKGNGITLISSFKLLTSHTRRTLSSYLICAGVSYFADYQVIKEFRSKRC